MKNKCPICHSPVAASAKKCRHCHNYLGFSLQWIWEEGLRVLSLVATVAAAVVAWKALEFTIVAQAQKEKAEAQAQISLQEREALKQDLSLSSSDQRGLQDAALSLQDKSLLMAAESSSDMRVRKVLAGALKLKQEGVTFSLGGKSPEEGFDSSGFVSYLLAEAGAIDPLYHATFSVAKLEKSFPTVKADQAKPGDLVFVNGSFVAFRLDQSLAVGIGNGKGVRVMTFSPKAKRSFRRWAYGQDIKNLK